MCRLRLTGGRNATSLILVNTATALDTTGFATTTQTVGNGPALRFKVGDRVKPRGRTKGCLSYGYVRYVSERRGYGIYWPQTGQCGDGWTDTDLA